MYVFDIFNGLAFDLGEDSCSCHESRQYPEIIEYITKHFTMEPGDIVATGTPGGIGPIQPGDVIEITIEKIGTLTNKVILEGK